MHHRRTLLEVYARVQSTRHLVVRYVVTLGEYGV